MRKIYQLTDQELGDAITNYINMRENKPFNPIRIVDSDMNPVPEKVSFEIESIPKGSTEAPHIFFRTTP